MINEIEKMIVVSRHEATIELIAEHISIVTGYERCTLVSTTEEPVGKLLFRSPSAKFHDVPIIRGNAKNWEVENKQVIGNLPLQLAASSLSITSLQFNSTPERGVELTREVIEKIGYEFVTYCVTKSDPADIPTPAPVDDDFEFVFLD